MAIHSSRLRSNSSAVDLLPSPVAEDGEWRRSALRTGRQKRPACGTDFSSTSQKASSSCIERRYWCRSCCSDSTNSARVRLVCACRGRCSCLCCWWSRASDDCSLASGTLATSSVASALNSMVSSATSSIDPTET